MKLTKTHKDLINALDKGDTLRPDGKFYVLANGDSRFTAKTVNPLIEEGLLVRGLFINGLTTARGNYEKRFVIENKIAEVSNEATPLPYTKEEIEEEGGFVTGWCINVHYSQGGNITEGCTTTHGHNTNGTDRTRSQRMGRVFKTKEDAVRMLEIECISEFAENMQFIANK